LPDYMVPQHFMKLEAMPLTPNGKVDRKALPKPEAESASARGYVAPRTEAEQEIAVVWQKALNLRRVGVHDNFFELGGNSLIGANVIAKINKVFGSKMPVGHIFRAPTVTELAKIVESVSGEAINFLGGNLELNHAVRLLM
jgi:hypothetical protein